MPILKQAHISAFDLRNFSRFHSFHWSFQKFWHFVLIHIVFTATQFVEFTIIFPPITVKALVNPQCIFIWIKKLQSIIDKWRRFRFWSRDPFNKQLFQYFSIHVNIINADEINYFYFDFPLIFNSFFNLLP